MVRGRQRRRQRGMVQRTGTAVFATGADHSRDPSPGQPEDAHRRAQNRHAGPHQDRAGQAEGAGLYQSHVVGDFQAETVDHIRHHQGAVVGQVPEVRAGAPAAAGPAVAAVAAHVPAVLLAVLAAVLAAQPTGAGAQRHADRRRRRHRQPDQQTQQPRSGRRRGPQFRLASANHAVRKMRGQSGLPHGRRPAP